MVDCALVLEGGALRCLFTAGVLDVMMERELEASYVIEGNCKYYARIKVLETVVDAIEKRLSH